MDREKQKILIFGLGQFARGLLKELSPDWHITVVDIRESHISESKEELPDATYIHGAAESMITWKQLDLTNIKYIISAVRSNDVDLEVCRIARKQFKLKIPVLVLVYNKVDKELFEPFNVTIINPLELGIKEVLQKMSQHFTRAANIGLGLGELVEVDVKARSHLVDRKLKYLRPSRWHISALYRNNQLILPTGNSSIKVGDRVLLVGDPAVLENITKLFLKGLPQFPLQYGHEILVPLHSDFDDNLEEALYFYRSFEARNIRFAPFKRKMSSHSTDKIKTSVEGVKVGSAIERFIELFPLPSDTGTVVIPADCGLLKENRLRKAFKRSNKPFLLSRKQFPYKGVLIHFNGPDPGQAMETGIEIAHLLDVPARALYVTLPKAMRGQEEDKRLRLRRQLIEDYEGIFKTSITYDVLEGNPIRKSLKYTSKPELEKYLMVIVTCAKAPLSLFNPNVPYFVAKGSPLSTLVIPEAHTDE